LNFPQVYSKTIHVDDAANVKPSNDANVEVFDVVHNEGRGVVVISFLQFYNPTIYLDIKDFDVYDFDPSNDHVSLDTIVCHQSPYDPKDDFLHLSMILSLVLILNFSIILCF
jgi:hypothetical protein